MSLCEGNYLQGGGLNMLLCSSPKSKLHIARCVWWCKSFERWLAEKWTGTGKGEGVVHQECDKCKKNITPPSRLHSDMLHLTKIETFTCGPFGLVLNSSTRSMRRLGLTVPSMTLYVNPISCRWTATIWSMLVHWDTITLDNKGGTRHEDHTREGNIKIGPLNSELLWCFTFCDHYSSLWSPSVQRW